MKPVHIEHVLTESRYFDPPPAFTQESSVSEARAAQMEQDAIKNPEEFWAAHARRFHWFKSWTEILKWQPPAAEWFCGGTTNISYNCLERNISAGLGEKIAFIWEGEPGERRTLTYRQLLSEVCQCAGALRELGVGPGDRVIVYMPLVPEAAVTMLACARIGAVHSVVFGGFSADAIRDRVQDSSAKVIVTADGGFRRGKIIALKAQVDAAFEKGMPTVQKVLVLVRTAEKIPMQSGRDVFWQEIVPNQKTEFAAAELDSEHPLFILYTSGSTGKPKGILHTTGGYMVETAFSTGYVFDLKPKDIYWCTADVGWITGHSYVVYGPLLNGATVFMYEGSPDFPDKDRFWKMIAAHRISILYTAPTAIRAFMKWGDQFVTAHDLSSLRLLGSVGEPINPQAWMWYRTVVGKERCPIVDTWWQTETGSIMIAPVPGVTRTKPGSATKPLPGIDAAVVDQDGKECAPDQGGYLVLKKPWPSMLRTIYNDTERFQKQYWSQYPGWYFTGDGARRDKDGYFWIVGRIDDVLNVAGHRLGTAEIESSLVSHAAVAEAAVVGAPDEIKGEQVVAFVTVKVGVTSDQTLAQCLKDHVTKTIGALARPERIIFTAALPKTRSGKIMRRLLRQIASGGTMLGDVTTLEDMSVVEALKNSVEEG